MKHYTTRVFRALTLLYLSFPITYLLFAALLFDIPAAQCVRILLSPVYWLISAIAIASGYGLLEMRRWGWYVFVLANGLVIYGNAYCVANYAESTHKMLAFIASLAITLGLVFRIRREVRVPYFLPRIRWWETNPRYRLSVPIAFTRKDGSKVEGDIVDLSAAGIFSKLKKLELAEDEEVELQFSMFGQTVKCRGLVVWSTESAVTHPRGAGVKFRGLPKQQRRILRAICQHMKKINVLYRSARYLLSQEEFLKRLDELEAATVPVVPEKRKKA